MMLFFIVVQKLYCYDNKPKDNIKLSSGFMYFFKTMIYLCFQTQNRNRTMFSRTPETPTKKCSLRIVYLLL